MSYNNIKLVINSLNLDYVKEKIEKFNSKALKLNKAELTTIYSDAYIDATDKDDIKELIDIEIIQLEEIVIADYKVIAKIDHTYPVKNFVKTYDTILTEEQEKEYQTVDCNCQHCNSQRKRNMTFMLQNINTLEYIQVGRTCLTDFLGHDITRTLNYFDLLEELQFDIFSFNGKSHQPNFYKIIDILAMIQTEIKLNGYNSSKQKFEHGIPSTGDNVKQTINFKNKGNVPSASVTEQKDIVKVIDYLKEFNADGEKLQDFYTNLKNILKYDYCKYSHIAMLSTVFVVVDIIKANILKQLEKQKSNFVGIVGDKIQKSLTLEARFGYDTDYGYMNINLFKDTEGNIYKWCSKNTLEIEVGEYKMVKATIKAHEEYNSQNQTVILRCKII